MSFKHFILFLLVNFVIIFSSICSDYSNYQHIAYVTLQDQSSGFSVKLNNNSYSPKKNYNQEKKVYELLSIQSMSENDIENLFRFYSNNDLFEQYHLYANHNYFSYIQSFSEYENFILKLHEKIHCNHKFRKSLRYIPGFRGKNGFADFIGNEVNKIKNERTKKENAKSEKIEQQTEFRTLKLDNKNNLNNISEEFCNSNIIFLNSDQDLLDIYHKRSLALNKTLQENNKQFDYSKIVKNAKFNDEYAEFFDYCYGTMLDKQLHEELCETRTKIIQLKLEYPKNINIKILSHTVNQFTALAKIQQNPEIAFGLSDFCYHLTKAAQEIGKAAEIVFNGVSKGLSNLVQHNVEFFTDLTTRPIDGILKPLCNAGMALGKALYNLCNNNPFELSNPIDISENGLNFASMIANKIYENPEETIALAKEKLL